MSAISILLQIQYQNLDTTLDDALENIDIGGPTMIRSAAKNIEWCCVVIDPNDYTKIIDGIDENRLVIRYS